MKKNNLKDENLNTSYFAKIKKLFKRNYIKKYVVDNLVFVGLNYSDQ